MILVTGATGFVGGHLIPVLCARGHNVRALVRAPALVPPGADPVVITDLSADVDWSSILFGVETVIHLAAPRVGSTGDGRLAAINVEGTRRIAEAAVATGVRRFIYLSSIAVLGRRTPPDVRWTEGTLPAPEDAYGRSKWQAEQALRSTAGGSGIALAIVRSPVVYGAGMRGPLLNLFRWISHGVPLPFGLVRNRRSQIFVGNLADALRALTEVSVLRADVFHVTDPEDLGTADLARRIARAVGRKVRLLPIPPPLLSAAGVVGTTLEQVTGRALPLNQDNVNRLLSSLWMEAGRIRTTLGWTAPWPVDAALRRTAEWFMEIERGGRVR